MTQMKDMNLGGLTGTKTPENTKMFLRFMEPSCQEKGENTILHTKNVNDYSESDGNEMTC